MDTSFVLAEAFGERAGRPKHRLEDFDAVFASKFLEAEYRSAFRREELEPLIELLAPITWMDVGRSLGLELERVLDAGYVRGADCWHLATALSLAPAPEELAFLTFDVRQRAVAKRLGFQV